jgi:hypothetical protein
VVVVSLDEVVVDVGVEGLALALVDDEEGEAEVDEAASVGTVDEILPACSVMAPGGGGVGD